MHNGFHVLSVDALLRQDDRTSLPGIDGCTALAQFKAHESLAYGVDWGLLGIDGKEDVVASCSFYDHNLRTWRI